MNIYLSLGSNMGDRRANILRAVSLLDDAFSLHHTRISSISESQSWGFQGADFLDCAVCYNLPDCGVDPVLHATSVLRRCKEIERQMGRTDPPEYNEEGERIYHDRIIDIDILFHGGDYINTEELCVPHKLISQRDFILIPLKEIIDSELSNIFKDILR